MQYRELYYGNLTNRAHPLNRGLENWWLCVPWYMSGPRWMDICGRVHGALTSGARFDGARGKPGWGSVFFDGSDDHVSLGTLDCNRAITISCWFKVATVAVGTMELFSGNTAVNFDVNRTAARLALLRNGAAVTVTSGTDLTAGRWYHTSGVISGTTGAWTCTIYLNGKSDGSAGTAENPVNASVSIGRLGAFDLFKYSGLIDSVRFYGRALSATECQWLYDEETRGNQNTLSYLPPNRWYYGAAPAPGGLVWNPLAGPLEPMGYAL